MNDFRQIWENIFQISQAVFRVTHLFPKDEILKRHLRAKITEILYQSSRGSTSGTREVEPRNILISEIHDFRSLLFTAKNCNFVDEKNITVLIKECENLLEKLDRDSEVEPRHLDRGSTSSIQEVEPRYISAMPYSPHGRQSRPLPTSHAYRQAGNFQLPTSIQSDIGFFVPNPRQQKILDYFHKNSAEKIRLKNITDELKNFSPRTIRQDLKELCENGFLIRNGGVGPGSYYGPNNAT